MYPNPIKRFVVLKLSKARCDSLRCISNNFDYLHTKTPIRLLIIMMVGIIKTINWINSYNPPSQITTFPKTQDLYI